MPELSYQSLVTGHEVLALLENGLLARDGATCGSSSEAAGNLVAANLTNPALDRHWRSASLDADSSNPVLRWKRSTAWNADFVVVSRHNLRRPFRARFYEGTDGGEFGDDPVYESPWTDPVVRADLDDYETFSEMPFSLGPSEEVLQEWQEDFRLESVIQADAVYSIRSMELEIDNSDQNNEGVDYFQIGFVMAGESFRPEYNMVYGWEMSANDRAQTRRTESGALVGRRRSIGRTLNLSIRYSDDRAEFFERLLTRWMRRHGMLGRIFIWPEPQERRFFLDQAMICTPVRFPKISKWNLNTLEAKGFQFEETE